MAGMDLRVQSEPDQRSVVADAVSSRYRGMISNLFRIK